MQEHAEGIVQKHIRFIKTFINEAEQEKGSVSGDMAMLSLGVLESALNTKSYISARRPPLGLRQKKFVDEDRMVEIMEAMIRYKEASKDIPMDWVLEYIDLYNGWKQ